MCGGEISLSVTALLPVRIQHPPSEFLLVLSCRKLELRRRWCRTTVDRNKMSDSLIKTVVRQHSG